MFYLKKIDDPIHPNYKKYINDYVFEIEDDANNVLIVPETRTFELYKYKNIQKIIWWQSVDNYYVSRKRFKNRVFSALGLKKFFKIEDPGHHSEITDHLVQSKYAELHLKENNIDRVFIPHGLHSGRFYFKIKSNIQQKEKGYSGCTIHEKGRNSLKRLSILTLKLNGFR